VKSDSISDCGEFVQIFRRPLNARGNWYEFAHRCAAELTGFNDERGSIAHRWIKREAQASDDLWLAADGKNPDLESASLVTVSA